MILLLKNIPFAEWFWIIVAVGTVGSFGRATFLLVRKRFGLAAAVVALFGAAFVTVVATWISVGQFVMVQLAGVTGGPDGSSPGRPGPPGQTDDPSSGGCDRPRLRLSATDAANSCAEYLYRGRSPSLADLLRDRGFRIDQEGGNVQVSIACTTTRGSGYLAPMTATIALRAHCRATGAAYAGLTVDANGKSEPQDPSEILGDAAREAAISRALDALTTSLPDTHLK